PALRGLFRGQTLRSGSQASSLLTQKQSIPRLNPQFGQYCFPGSSHPDRLFLTTSGTALARSQRQESKRSPLDPPSTPGKATIRQPPNPKGSPKSLAEK